MEKEEFRVYKDTRIFSKNGKLLKGALWEVSNYGNVRKNGEDYIPYENNGGYLHFGCHNSVHRAVAELFLPSTEHKPTIDHINRCIHDNRACNLRWATWSEQAANKEIDAFRKSISKSLIGNKRSLGYKHSEESKAKMSSARLGNKNALGHSPSEEVRTKMSKYVSNTVWIIHPITNDIKRIPKEQIPEYIDKGYVRGRKPKK